MNYINQKSKSSWGLCLLILLFIFSPVLSTQETAQPGALYVIVIVVPTVIMAIQKGLIQSRTINIFAILLFVEALLSSAVSEMASTRPGTYMKYLMLILFFISVNSVVLTHGQLKFSLKAYLGLSIVLSVLILLSVVFGYPHTASDYYQGRYSIGITGLYKNPNYLVSFYNISFFVICYILATVKMKVRKKVVLYLLLIMFIVSSFFTGTRAALLVEFLIILSMAIVLARKHDLYRVIPLVVIAVIVLIHYSEGINDIVSAFLGNREAFGDEGRTRAWNLAIQYIKESPILGCGHNSWYSIHGSSYLEWLHNVFLELFLDQGLIGFVLFLCIMITGYKKTNKDDRLFLLLFLLFSSMPMYFQNGLYEVHFWRYIIINRLLMNISSSYGGGINEFFRSAFGDKYAHQRIVK